MPKKGGDWGPANPLNPPSQKKSSLGNRKKMREGKSSKRGGGDPDEVRAENFYQPRKKPRRTLELTKSGWG